jgi:hypothetical protein
MAIVFHEFDAWRMSSSSGNDGKAMRWQRERSQADRRYENRSFERLLAIAEAPAEKAKKSAMERLLLRARIMDIERDSLWLEETQSSGLAGAFNHASNTHAAKR